MVITRITVINALKKIDPASEILENNNEFRISCGIKGNLEDLFRSVQLSQKPVEAAIRDFLNLAANYQLPNEMGREEALTKIFPRIVSLRHDTEPVVDAVPTIEICNDLVQVLVLDGPRAMYRLHRKDLAHWDMDEEEAFAVALDNLIRHTVDDDDPVRIDRTIEGGCGVVFDVQDGYAASRLLLPNLWERFSPELGPEFVAAIPHRDSLVLLSSQPSLLARVKPRILTDFGRFPRPITPQYVGVCRDGLFQWGLTE